VELCVYHEHSEQDRTPLAHTQTEGRAPVWGYEFSTKAGTLQGGSSEFMPSLCVVGIGSVAALDRVLVHEILHRGVRAFNSSGVRCASQLIDRFSQAEVRDT
jgi:hypothetical protein